MVGAKVISVFAKADKLIKSAKSIASAYNALGGSSTGDVDGVGLVL